MADKGAGVEERGLWQRWQALGDAPSPAEPDALLLAAYAEGRLSEAEAETVETWLAVEPAGLDDIIAARDVNQHPPHLVYQHVLGNACDLVEGVADDEAARSNVIPLRRRAPQWRSALAWSGIAASLLCVSLVGFSAGSAAYTNIAQTQTVDNSSSDGLDTPSSLDSYFYDDSST